MRSPRDPWHPANFRLRLLASVMVLAGVLLWIGTILGHIPAIITIPVAAALFFGSFYPAQLFLLRARPYMTRAEHLRGILVAILLCIAIGFGAIHILPWLIQNFSAKP